MFSNLHIYFAKHVYKKVKTQQYDINKKNLNCFFINVKKIGKN